MVMWLLAGHLYVSIEVLYINTVSNWTGFGFCFYYNPQFITGFKFFQLLASITLQGLLVGFPQCPNSTCRFQHSHVYAIRGRHFSWSSTISKTNCYLVLVLADGVCVGGRRIGPQFWFRLLYFVSLIFL